MLNVQKMIASARECLGWPYESPGSNDANGIDCAGLFVKIFQDQGAKIYHGSNTIWRKFCYAKGPLNNISDLCPGAAVFKHKDKDTEKYPDGQGDFCHIGFVASVEPLEIIHASSEAGCVVTDTKLGKWSYFGRLNDVVYEIKPDPEPEPAPEVIFAAVYSDNRKPVKLRMKPSTSCSIYDEVPFGSIVEVVEKGEKWSKVNYGNRRGWYMMTKFLLIDESSIPGIGGTEGVTVTIDGLTMSEAEGLQLKYPQAIITAG